MNVRIFTDILPSIHPNNNILNSISTHFRTFTLYNFDIIWKYSFKKASEEKIMSEFPNEDLLRAELAPSLEQNLSIIKQLLNVPLNEDVVLRRYACCDFSLCAIYIEGMADDKKISEFILHACKEPITANDVPPDKRIDLLVSNYVEIAQCSRESQYKQIIPSILGGMTCIIADGADEALLMETRGFAHRPVGKPSNEAVVIGSQEGFVESLRTNITLLRRYVQSSELITERLTVGTKIPSNVALLYLKDVVDDKMINEVRRRLKSIQSPSVQGIGSIQQLIEDQPHALFPQMLQTERPDRAASCLSEGQFVILADNSPYALTAPITMYHLIHSSDDTFMRWQYATFLRCIRIIGILLSLFLPGLYVALTLHHTHLVPLSLLLSIAETRADVPFTILFEVLVMEFCFYLINEAGTRIPSQIGPTISIVGALILGQAAVSASIISPILIILIALTGLGNYAIPNYSLTLSLILYRQLVILFSAFLGLYGFFIAAAIISVHLCSIHSFGIPYLAPISPYRPHNPDILTRLSLRLQKRPMFYAKVGNWMNSKEDDTP